LCDSLESELEFSQDVTEEANAKKVDLAGYKIHAGPEQLRQPRIVRIGAVQNKIVLSTTAPVAEQVSSSVRVVNNFLVYNCQSCIIISNMLLLFLIIDGSNSLKNWRNCEDCQSMWCKCYLFSGGME
jgi:hypothetical protein